MKRPSRSGDPVTRAVTEGIASRGTDREVFEALAIQDVAEFLRTAEN